MNNLNYLFILGFVFLFACNNKETSENKDNDTLISENRTPVEVPADTKLLLDYLTETGDYVNSREFPSLIKASIVYEELNKKNLVIDIRKPENYRKGHIKDAVNVNFNDIPEYFQSKIKPFEYEKIIIVCSTGQYASYTTSLLRLMGYGNVYAMRWGMSAWEKESAKENWLKGVSAKFETQLETKENEKPQAGAFPELKSKASGGEAVLQERIKQVFTSAHENSTIAADTVFSNLSKYYIINIERKDKYDAGHIPGSIRYKPNGTLGIVEEMGTIPAGKDLVIYCGTGHNSAFITAYLNLFGYKAHTLDFGNNSFMHDKMLKDKETLSWVLFGEGDILNYPLVK
jgi:rhodanese-related sulfurtransferase